MNQDRRILVFNKPFGVLCQFSPEGDTPTLADYIDIPGVYPAGRLDKDSEGLLILTANGKLQHHIANPRRKQPKTYWAQVDGAPEPRSLRQLERGVVLKDGRTRPTTARLIDEPAELWNREPPIRYRKNIPTSWIELTLREGKNRQVRRMTAAVNHPTLRLIRSRIGQITLNALQPGEFRWDLWRD